MEIRFTFTYINQAQINGEKNTGRVIKNKRC